MPPQRHPATALSFGHHTMGYSRKLCDSSLTLTNITILSLQLTTFIADISDNSSFIYQASGDFRLPTTKSHDSLSIQSIDSMNYSDQNRCASVKSRPSARRISAAELEYLMIKQGTSQFQPIPSYEQVSLPSNT